MSKIYEALELARKTPFFREKEIEAPLPKTYKTGALDLEIEEEMVTLYQNINSLLPDVQKPSLLFVGSHSNEGASTIARQFAKTCSLTLGKTVLLVDLDRSRPNFHLFVDVEPECDLEEVIKADAPVEKAYCQVEESSLYVMPLFQQTSLSPRTLDSSRSDDFWGKVRDRFDLTIIDAPPATLFPDGLGFVRQVNGVILVFEAEKTRWPVAMNVKQKIEKQGGNILGIVFNKRRFYIPDWLYRRLY